MLDQRRHRGLAKLPLKLLTLSVLAIFTACGTSVPSLQEIPGGPGTEGLFIKSITDSIYCELQGAVKNIINEDNDLVKNNKARSYPWFDKWGVQGTLTLSVTEKTDVNPSALWTSNPVSKLFALGFGLEGSAKATNNQITNFYYNVSDLYLAGDCDPKKITLIPDFGSLLVSSNLGFKEYLVAEFFQIGTGNIQSVSKNGLTKDITFEVVSSANLNPAWNLKYWSINPTGNLLSVSRDRTHEIAVTFGPADPTQKRLVGPAADQVLATQIGAAIASRLQPTIAR